MTDKPISRQLAWQRRMKSAGRCVQCGKKSVKSRCTTCGVAFNRYRREQYIDKRKRSV